MQIQQYLLGDTDVTYLISEEGQVSLLLLPHCTANFLARNWEIEGQPFDPRNEYYREWKAGSLVQLHLRHHNRGNGSGLTMKCSESTSSLTFAGQHREEYTDSVRIITTLKSPENYSVIHTLTWPRQKQAFFCDTTFVNESCHDFDLEMLSSFCLENLSPFQEANDQTGCLNLHRFRGSWALEGMHICDSIEALGLQKAWCAPFVKSEKFGSVGSWTTERFFPTAAVEDKEHHVFWSAALEHNASWMMELTRNGDTLSFSGGIADMETGAWMKRVKAGESFTAPRAYLSAVKGDIYDACQRLTSLEDMAATSYGEKGLPIIFNEYCTSWGNPTQDKMLSYANILKGKGIRYLVIDAGWSLGSQEQLGNGEWLVDPKRFPDMKGMVKELRDMGFIPGIWLEFEVTTEGARVYEKAYDDMHLKRDGVVIHTGNVRTYWDFRDKRVIEYLSEHVIGLLKENDFGYLKVDYNGNIGLGCDGAESLGEGLRCQMAAVREFFRKIKREIPDIIIESCASGGHRSEPSMLGVAAMTSFSDAHEAREIPYIAANLQNLILPRQNQIWTVLRADDKKERIEYGIAAGFLGRICLSGDIDKLSEDQWRTVEEGLAFYRNLEHLILNGVTKLYGERSPWIRHPEGTQVVMRRNEDELLVVCHGFKNTNQEIEIPIGDGFEIKTMYGQPIFSLKMDTIIIQKMDEWTAGAIYLTKKR